MADFMDEWDKFGPNLRGACDVKIDRRPALNPLRTTLHTLFDLLVSSRVRSAVDRAVDSMTRLPDERPIVDLLAEEMAYFNGRFSALGASSPEDEIDSGLESGKTIKDSIDDVVTLPRWVRKLLKVLNELLSLVRGG